MAIHPRHFDPACTPSPETFATALAMAKGSGIAELIIGWNTQQRRPSQGGRRRLPYTILGWQTALIVRGLLSQPPTITGTFRTLLDFTAAQLAEVGIDDSALEPMRSNFERAYKSFAGWLDAELECLDSGPDQPASRITVAQSRAIERARTPEQRAAYKLAGERRAEVVNAIVSAWIDPALREGRRGDLVADGMIVDLAGPSPDFTRQEKQKRAAAYYGAYYRRDSRHRLDSEGNRIAKKRGWGIEVTAVTSVGPVGAPHSVPPLFTGISIHKPTSGSLEGLDQAVRFHRQAGFDTRAKAANARRPLLVADMGYLKKGWGTWQIENGYAAIFRYPENWTSLVLPAVDPTGANRKNAPGPTQIEGNFYCPAAVELYNGRRMIRPLRTILDKDAWEAHDVRLKRMMPMVMGVNRRAYEAGERRGRPTRGSDGKRVMKMEFTCPAALGNVRCARWLNPATDGRDDLPFIDPGPEVPVYRCCRQKATVVTLTDDQVQRQQHSQYIPGSWMHAITYEAYRALTEQRFDLVRRRPSTGLEHLKYGARREPVVCITIAVAFAVVNWLTIQGFKHRGIPDFESIDERWQQLTDDLGHDPATEPPRS